MAVSSIFDSELVCTCAIIYALSSINKYKNPTTATTEIEFKNFQTLYLLIIIIIFLLLYLLVRAFGPVTVTASETLQNPKATVEVKELIVDISKDGGSKPNLVVKLHILPIYVHIGEPRISCDQSPNLNTGETFSAGQASFPMMEKYSAPFSCEEFSLSCEFGHNRYFFFFPHSVDVLVYCIFYVMQI